MCALVYHFGAKERLSGTGYGGDDGRAVDSFTHAGRRNRLDFEFVSDALDKLSAVLGIGTKDPDSTNWTDCQHGCQLRNRLFTRTDDCKFIRTG